MKTRLLHLWDIARGSFWFVPAAMALVCVILGWTMPLIDAQHPNWTSHTSLRFIANTAPAARSFLATAAGSIVTLAGVVFSITIVTLSIASAQYGSRILRSFMTDKFTHLCLGTLIGASLYCFFVLTTVRDAPSDPFIPQLSIGLAMLFTMLSLVVLVLFTHHVAVSIQAPSVVQKVVRDLDDAVDRLYPSSSAVDESAKEGETEIQKHLGRLGGEFKLVTADKEGYLQAVDLDGLIALSKEHDLTLYLEFRPGDFVIGASPLARAWPSTSCTEEVARLVSEAFIMGSRRTLRQDVECAVNELVEVAVRALSPGINDPFTAMNCIDHLAGALSRLAERSCPVACRYDENSQLRIIAPPITFPKVLDTAFNQIRQYGRSSVAVTIRMLEALERIAMRVRREADAVAVLRQAEMIKKGSEEALPECGDREDVAAQYAKVIKALQEKSLGQTRVL